MTRARSMVVAGVMSGTSADGVDVALCRIAGGRGPGAAPRIEILGHRSFGYSKAVREAVLGVMAGGAIGAAELSRLGWRLGSIYADAVETTAVGLGETVELVGCHGQTVHHEATGVAYLGERVRSTMQVGEAAVVAERMHCPVVSDFRPADLAAGGQGAPLVPMLDAMMFRSPKVGRVLANLGGIANVTALPPGRGLEGVMAFDTGPGNMVIDHCMRRLYGREFDAGGETARGGKVYAGEVMRAMRSGFFAERPPKSCGREEFGERFGEGLIAHLRKAGAEDADVVATATALTASSMVEAYEMFVAERMAGGKAAVELIVAGGGVRNRALMGMLGGAFGERGVEVRPMDELGTPAEAKEAVAFALLAWLSWHRRPGNVPGATGAGRGVVLGKVSFG